MARIGHEVEDVCPECGEEGHSTLHFFTCNRRPTALTVADLWTRPREVAAFLDLPTSEDGADAERPPTRSRRPEVSAPAFQDHIP